MQLSYTIQNTFSIDYFSRERKNTLPAYFKILLNSNDMCKKIP